MPREKIITMSNSLNIQLTTELREFVRDLIRKDRAQRVASSIVQGLQEIRQGKSVNMMAIDILNEK